MKRNGWKVQKGADEEEWMKMSERTGTDEEEMIKRFGWRGKDEKVGWRGIDEEKWIHRNGWGGTNEEEEEIIKKIWWRGMKENGMKEDEQRKRNWSKLTGEYESYPLIKQTNKQTNKTTQHEILKAWCLFWIQATYAKLVVAEQHNW